PDGPRTVQITYIPDRAPDGRVAGFYSLIIDITERTRAEKALRYLADASVALANSLDYESTLDMVARLAVPAIADWCTIDLLSEDGQLELVSVAHMDPAKVAWGYELRRRYPMDPNAPVGAPLVMRTGQPEFYPIITDELLQAISKTPEDLALLRSIGYSSVMIVPLRTRDRALGTITFVATESRRHFSEADLAIAEEIARRAATSIDNALLFRAVQTREQELRASEERSQQQLAELQLVYATAPVGLAVLDRQQRYLRVNETLAAMNGYAAEEHLGKTGRDLFPGIAEQAEHLVQQVLETGQPVVNVEISGETPAFPGAPRIWLESFYPLRSPDGVIVGINAVVQDITERKQQEAELKALNETLERRVEERTAELARSNRELDQFAYVASHDLKAPLRNIAQLAAWISEDANGQLPPTAQGHLARMQSRILRMNTLLDDLLTYSRAGRLNDALNQVTLATLL
ncbi:MAG TPA: PAS domain-containing protein, partial [Caldilineaceae bacterium]|nr:PAS domain-containing protein [Caldilineaceae bacterium]